MKLNRNLLLSILVLFAVLSVYAVLEVGYLGIFDYHRHSPAGWQVFTDLVIALILLLAWMIPDAKQQGRNPWPFVMLTLTLGSFGPLLYLVTARDRLGETNEATGAAA